MENGGVVKSATRELVGGFSQMRLWSFMARRELKLRYARSFIGPFWITLAMGTWLIALSLVYGGLFGASLSEITPHILLGIVPWTFLSATIDESSSCLIRAKSFFLQAKMPLTTFVYLVVFRNLIVGLHHMVIFIALVFVFQLWPNANWLWALVGLLLLVMTAFGLALTAAVLTPRFRDLEPLIVNLTTVGFFLSPVMWRPQDLVRNSFVYDYNPFAHLLDVFRMPLLGEAPDPTSLLIASCTAVVALLTGFIVLGANRNRVIFWL